MKSKETILGLLLFFSCVICTFYFLFYCPFAFDAEFSDYGQYFPAFIVVCSWLAFLIIGLFLKKEQLAGQRLLMLVGSVGIGYLLCSDHYSFANEYFAEITNVVLVAAMLLSAGIKLLHMLLIFLAGMFIWQLYIAFSQMHGFAFNIQPLNISGTLQNSGIFSCYLVTQLPFIYYLFFCVPLPGKGKVPEQVTHFFKIVRVLVFAVIFSFVVSIIWRSQSRTALIALAALLVSFFVLNYGKAVKTTVYKLPRALVWSAAGVLLTGIGCIGWYLIGLKKLSAISRVMTLDIARGHLADHFWLGTGIGRFPWYYPQWQAQYFATHQVPSKDYFLIAGEVYGIFNEYLQLLQTIGLPGFIVFILLLTWFFTRRSTRRRALLNAAKCTVIAVLACGFTSYPFHINILLLLLVVCFAIAAVVSENKRVAFQIPPMPHRLHNVVAGVYPIVLIVIAGVAVYAAFGQWQAKQAWNKLRNQLDGSRAEIVAAYGRLYKPLQRDGKFLTDYGVTLQEDSADCGKAAMVLEEAKKYFISKTTIESLGQAYKKTGNYPKAIENYTWLCHYLPNKFGIKLELLKLYEVSGDTLNARQTAHMILTMPVKLRSHELDEIKIETANILNRLQ